MHITDPIADMLTRVRNAGSARHATVDVPASGVKKAIAQILLDNGYIKSFELVDNGTQGIMPTSPTQSRASAEFPSPAFASTPAERISPRFSKDSVLRSFQHPRAL